MGLCFFVVPKLPEAVEKVIEQGGSIGRERFFGRPSHLLFLSICHLSTFSFHLCFFKQCSAPAPAAVVRGNALGVSNFEQWPPARTAPRHSIGGVAVPARGGCVV